MLRVIREVRPTWVVGENVPGLVNWSGGVVFEEVQSDLEAEGYEVQSFILPAAGVGAPHRRDRVWIVAYNATNSKGEQNNRNGSRGFLSKFAGVNEPWITSNPTSDRRLWNRSGFAPGKGQQQGFFQAGQLEGGFEGLRFQGDVTDPSDTRLQRGKEFRHSKNREWQSGSEIKHSRCNKRDDAWSEFPTQSPICNGDDGISARLVRYILRTGGDCYTEEDCIKEGIEAFTKDERVFKYGLEGWAWLDMPRSPIEAYARLIGQINGKGTWESNPFVFVYDYELMPF